MKSSRRAWPPKPKGFPKPSRRGFSLLEVVFAMAVLTLGLTATLMTLQLGMRSLDFARRNTVATQALQNEAERLRLMKWDEISALPPEGEVDLATTFGPNAIPGGALRILRRIEDMPDMPGMKVILLEASWTGVDGRSHQAHGRIDYARGGINDYYYFHGTPAPLE